MDKMIGINKIKKLKRLIAIVLVFAFGFNTIPNANQKVNALENNEVTIYGVASANREKITIPASAMQEYQIPIKGEGVTYRVTSGSSAKVSATGLVTPKYSYWKSSGSFSVGVGENDEYD